MTDRMRKRNISSRQIEQDLETLFRRTGALLPTEETHFFEPTSSHQNYTSYDLTEALDFFDRKRARSRRSEAVSSLAATSRYWKHPSVLGLQTPDPIHTIVTQARQLVLDAMEKGWAGPPYDPFDLASRLGIQLLPRQDVIDARTRSDEKGKLRIEFNPTRPLARRRYSIAHEIGHTLFPDCAVSVRNRATHQDLKGSDWQLEMLCNLAAAEILMPLGTLQDVTAVRPSVDRILELRRKYLVSCESVMVRLTRLTGHSCVAFAARLDLKSSRYQVEYRIPSPVWGERIPIMPGHLLPKSSKASECTAIGTVQRAEETWISKNAPWYFEFLGVSPYTGDTQPRVLAIGSPLDSEKDSPLTSRLKFMKGDATEPFGAGEKILLQVVNDKALIWGVGFARQIRKKWPQAQAEFGKWVFSNKQEFKLGNVHVARLRPDLGLVSLVAQKGYGFSKGPRIRYAALLSALEKVRDLALRQRATVHMPRIGSGEAGGNWYVIEEIIQETLTNRGIQVTVYDLPSAKTPFPQQPSFEFPRGLADEIT
jgi:O-acetyl-ADP-ribose deacetylase (regulator of RNase III)